MLEALLIGILDVLGVLTAGLRPVWAGATVAIVLVVTAVDRFSWTIVCVADLLGLTVGVVLFAIDFVTGMLTRMRESR
jgi:hypothetical protein